MLLNLMRVEGVEPEELMHRSYRQFQTERLLPALQQKLRRLEVGRDSLYHVEGMLCRSSATYP